MTADDLDIISPPERIALLGGHEYTLRPLTVGQIPRLMRALRTITGGLEASTAIDFGAMDAAQAVGLMADHGDTLIDVVAAATDLPLDVVTRATIDEFVDAFASVMELNHDFFVQRVLPQLAGTLQRVQAKAAATRATAGRGPTPLRR